MKSHLHDTNLHDKTRSETLGVLFHCGHFDVSEISFRVIKYHVNYFGLKVRITFDMIRQFLTSVQTGRLERRLD